MFALERLRLIRNYLGEQKQVEVNSLSKLLDVSEVTIRRDLEKLEKDGLLIRTHGGAVPVSVPDAGSADGFEARSQLGHSGDATKMEEDPGAREAEAESRREIGRTAARLVSDGDALLILSGPLCRTLAQALRNKKGLTVLTNDLIVAADLAKAGRNRVVLLGGDLNGEELAVSGAIAAEDIHRFQVDRLFAQVDGFGSAFELSVRTQEQALLIREGRGRARAFVVLCEGSAFGRNAFFSFGIARSGDMIVTDRSLSDEDKRKIFDANLRLFTAVDIYEGAV